MLGLVGVVAPATARAEGQATVAQEATRYLGARVTDLVTRTGPDDNLYQAADGSWQVGDAGCLRCLLGPSVVTAVLAQTDPHRAAEYRRLTVASVEQFLGYQHADGGWPDTLAGPSDGIPTEFVGQQLGTIVLTMGDGLDAARRARWTDALVATARFLVKHGDVQWYANGNVNLGYTLTLGLAARASGDAALEAAYEASWAFTLAPAGAKWSVFGLRYATTTARADASDGAGYLVENGAGGAGFDAHYTQLQADIATRMWLMLGDQRAYRIVNLTTNMLRGRVNAAWMLDTGNGSRHPSGGLSFPYITAGLAASAACRSDLDGQSRAQLTALESWFDRNLEQRSLYDNDDWAFYLGESAANFALLGAAPACGSTATWQTAGGSGAKATATAPPLTVPAPVSTPSAPAAARPTPAAPSAHQTAPAPAAPAPPVAVPLPVRTWTGPPAAAPGLPATATPGLPGAPTAAQQRTRPAGADARSRAQATSRTQARARARARSGARTKARAKARARARARRARGRR